MSNAIQSKKGVTLIVTQCVIKMLFYCSVLMSIAFVRAKTEYILFPQVSKLQTLDLKASLVVLMF